MGTRSAMGTGGPRTGGAMTAVDLATRRFWRWRGRPVELGGTHSWLNAVRSPRSEVGEDWLLGAAKESGGELLRRQPDAGLLSDMTLLDGPGFDSARLRPEIRDFYENTTRWRLEVWTEWNPLFIPAGELLAKYFGRRVKQLAIPTRPLEVALGMDSEISLITDASGEQAGAAWIRRLRSTGEYLYSGYYRPQLLPSTPQPSVNVAFPLESGNVQVFLRPRTGRGGSLLMDSGPGEFGDHGTYVVVQDGGRFYAARVPLHERFRVYVDDEGVLRTDHVIRFARSTAVRLHYKMERLHESRG